MKRLLSRHARGPRIELICVGTELLMGKPNAHGPYLARRLEDLGFALARETTVSDDPEEMSAAFARAWRESDLVLCTGGLGPTFDDLTREVWARVAGRRLVHRREILSLIRERFRRRGLRMPAANARQARILEGARVLSNAQGTAPGQILEAGRRTLVLLPGPGREMKPMVEGAVEPYLAERWRPEPRRTRVWRLFGLPESAVDEELRRLFRSVPAARRRGLVWGILAQGWIIDIKVTAAGRGGGRPDDRLKAVDRMLRRRLGPRIFGQGEETLEALVGERLRSARRTVATAESCTGGLLAQKITAVPGSSDYFRGGFVVYADAAKSRWLGVPRGTLARHGAVSAPVARALAEAARRRAGTDYALSITGVAGPAGGTGPKPVGLVYVGAAGPRGTEVIRRLFLGGRAEVREQAALAALDLLRRALPKA